MYQSVNIFSSSGHGYKERTLCNEATIDPETQRECGFITVLRADTPTNVGLVTILENSCRALGMLLTTQSLKLVPNTLRSSKSTENKNNKSS